MYFESTCRSDLKLHGFLSILLTGPYKNAEQFDTALKIGQLMVWFYEGGAIELEAFPAQNCLSLEESIGMMYYSLGLTGNDYSPKERAVLRAPTFKSRFVEIARGTKHLTCACLTLHFQ
jgi:hypothetical protein